jgi:hypothetical protein
LVVIGGAPSLDYSITGGTCASGTTNATCTVVVQFLPTVVGSRLGMLVFSDQSGTTLVTVPLSGTGSGPLVAFGPGTITTFAGGNGAGYTGDTAAATAAQLYNPSGVALDAAGNLYISDTYNHAIRKVTSGGVISTVAGGNGAGSNGDGGLATAAQLNYPGPVRVDGGGNLYISDSGNNRIRMVTPAGTITTVAGGGTVCATASNSLGDGCPATSAILNGPWGTVSDGRGNLYIGDAGDNVVRKVGLDGTITTVAGTGVAGYSGDGLAATAAQLSSPQLGAIDGGGNLYIADIGNNVIRKITPAGTITTVAGNNAAGPGYSGDGGAATAAQLYYPQEVTVDAAGDLYIADSGNHPSQGSGYNVVRKVTPGGIISTVAGNGTQGYSGDTGPATSSQMYGPWDIAVDGLGNLYIADTFNNAIRKVDVSDAPSLNFGSIGFGVPSAAQDVALVNLGNTPLTINAIGIAPNFSAGGADTTCSTSSQTLNAGASCVLGIELIPTTTGSIGGSVVLADNNLNVSSNTQTIALQGIGVPASQAISVSIPAALTYGVGPVPLGATTASPIRASGPFVTQTRVTQTLRAKPGIVPPSLNVSATSGLPVSITVISGPATISNNSLIVNGAGVVTLKATQPGDENYNPAAPVSVTIPVHPAPLSLTANYEEKEFDWPVPALSGTLAGVVAGDGITASYSTTAVENSPAGAYPITAKLNDPKSRLSNYSVTVTNGTLTVTAAVFSAPLEQSLSPVGATAGGAGFTLTVNGANFAANSVVLWNGAVRKTTRVSSAQLTATIPASDLSLEGTAMVTVVNPAPDAGTSAAIPFVVQSSAPQARITGASLASAFIGGNHILTLTGRDFVPNSTVKWNGAPLTTTYLSPWQLSVVVPASDYASLPAMVTVTNSAGTSPGFVVQ